MDWRTIVAQLLSPVADLDLLDPMHDHDYVLGYWMYWAGIPCPDEDENADAYNGWIAAKDDAVDAAAEAEAIRSA